MENVKPSESGAIQMFIDRTIHAPRELVWRAWTESDRLKIWSGPKSYTTPVFDMDPRVGGRYFNCMKSGDGQEIYSTGTILEMVTNEKLVLTDSFADDQGNIVSASYYGMEAGFPLVNQVTVKLADAGGQTKLTIKYVAASPISEEHLTGMRQGWNESIDKLDAYLAGEVRQAP
jgi:uncharacterized protein YndB with AHSA1/START domain